MVLTAKEMDVINLKRLTRKKIAELVRYRYNVQGINQMPKIVYKNAMQRIKMDYQWDLKYISESKFYKY